VKLKVGEQPDEMKLASDTRGGPRSPRRRRPPKERRGDTGKLGIGLGDAQRGAGAEKFVSSSDASQKVRCE
jgi:hypothetical protein